MSRRALIIERRTHRGRDMILVHCPACPRRHWYLTGTSEGRCRHTGKTFTIRPRKPADPCTTPMKETA